MVRSKEELLQCASAWVNQAKSDIRNQIVNFIQMSGTTEAQLADALAISRDELISIIETNNDISLSTFAKLLIATDNVLEIKPLVESPLANGQHTATPQTAPQRPQTAPMQQPRDSHGRFCSQNPRHSAPTQQPRNGGMPFGGPRGGVCIDRDGYPVDPRTGRRIPNMPRVPMDNNGRPVAPNGGFPMPNGGMAVPPQFGEQAPFMGGMPGMSRRMHGVAPQPEPIPVAEPAVGGSQPLDSLSSKSRAELVQMIQDNFWDGEINCEEVSKTDLINFLISKRPQPAPVAQTAPVAQPTTNTEATDASYDAFKKMLDDAVAQNPHLADVISQYNVQR